MKSLLAALVLLVVAGCASIDSEATLSSAAASAVFVRLGPVNAASGSAPHGSGVVIAKGKVLTAGHVALAATDTGILEVEFADGTRRAVGDGELGDGSIGEDYAILDVDTGKTPAAPYSCARVLAGTPVFTFGSPLFLRGVATWGHVASDVVPKYEEAPRGARVLDMTVLPGNSGGAVFAMIGGRAAVVGIVVQLVPWHGGASGLSVMLPLSSTSVCD